MKDCRDTRSTLNIMIQQNKSWGGGWGEKELGSTLTENNPLEVWDDDCDGAVLP